MLNLGQERVEVLKSLRAAVRAIENADLAAVPQEAGKLAELADRLQKWAVEPVVAWRDAA